MQRGAIKKHYLAIAKGWPKELQFSVNAPILRRGLVEPSAIWLKQIVHSAGSAALTHFRLLDRLTDGQGERFSLIEAEPITGRMHQIRVHLAHAGHPVVGDKLYGPDERCYLEFIETGWTATLAARLSMPRQALHSARLEIREYPFAGAWEAPVPEDMRQFLAGLNKADIELSA
jgi:23S rRNA pseudouridine1911/1915/1917 synthase